MFYLAEEYVMQNRQRELSKKLDLKRQLRDSIGNKSSNRLHFFAEIEVLLRNLARVFRADTSESIDAETPLDCVAC